MHSHNHLDCNCAFCRVAACTARHAVSCEVSQVVCDPINPVVPVFPVRAFNFYDFTGRGTAVKTVSGSKLLERFCSYLKTKPSFCGVPFVLVEQGIERVLSFLEAHSRISGVGGFANIFSVASARSSMPAKQGVCGDVRSISAGTDALPHYRSKLATVRHHGLNSQPVKRLTRKVFELAHFRHLEKFTMKRVWQAVVKPLFGSYPSHGAYSNMMGKA